MSISPRDPLCKRVICIRDQCPHLEDQDCSDAVRSREIDGPTQKKVYLLEEEMILAQIPNASSTRFNRADAQSRSGLPGRRAMAAFERLIRNKLIYRVKGSSIDSTAFYWDLTEAGRINHREAHRRHWTLSAPAPQTDRGEG